MKKSGNDGSRIANNSEEYALNQTQRGIGLDRLGVPRNQVCVDLFASDENAQDTFFCSEDNSAFRHTWEDFSSGEDGAEPWLCPNPPFKEYARVLCKLLKEKVRLVLLIPSWPKQWWFEPLRAMAERTVSMGRDQALYQKTGEGGHMPAAS